MNNMAHAVLRLLEKNKIDYTLAEHPAVFNMEELYAQGLEHCDAIAKNLLVRDQKTRSTGSPSCWMRTTAASSSGSIPMIIPLPFGSRRMPWLSCCGSRAPRWSLSHFDLINVKKPRTAQYRGLVLM